MRLILFDIDGTLLHANGAGRAALTEALSTLTDRSISTSEVSFSGRTDPEIFEDVMAENGLPTTNSFIEQAMERYLDALEETLSSSEVEVLPGIPDLLSRLDDHSEVMLGLVTGNLEPAAYAKLSAIGLRDYFSFGGFGSDHADRTKLPLIAARRASSHTGYSIPSPEDIVIVGDTVHDIQCGHAVGARVVAVCTGRYERATLSRFAPSLLLDTLQDTESFIRNVVGDN